MSVGTAEAALKAHYEQPFDLLMVDWTLPGISGLDLCKIVRARPGGDDVVILVVTGRNRPEDLHAVLDAGASDYLAKPIDPESLRTRLVAAERMRHIVRDLKTFSRADDDLKANVSVTKVLESSINMCWNEIRHRCTLHREFDDPPLVEANESRLGQVFLNLLINASQAMPGDDVHRNSITVRAFENDAGETVVQVIDNGHGIAKGHLKRIFDPFFITKKQSEGTGLGLSICRNLVEAESGVIEVESVENEGTTIEVRLPATTKEITKKHTLLPPPATEDPRAKVVVIDDEELVGKSIQRALRNHDVQVFTNPIKALEVLRSSEVFDVIFCDIMMPEMSGTELYTQVQMRRPDVAERFVFITGGAFTTSARDFLARTPVLCLDKPFDVAQLRELVRERTSSPVG